MVQDSPHDAVAPELFRVGVSPLLRPEEQVFQAMLDGWATQQRSRGLRTVTINSRLSLLARFQTYTGEYPWAWKAVDFDRIGWRMFARTAALPSQRFGRIRTRSLCSATT